MSEHWSLTGGRLHATFRSGIVKIRSLFIALLLSLLSSFAIAASTECPQHYLGGQAPDFLNEKLSAKTQQVCYDSFGLIHSGITRTPLTAAEHLTRERLTIPHPERKNAFHPDEHISPFDRAELDDYKGSGYDRGHMAPSGDMPTEQSQYESFSLANMVPQDPNNNRNLWEGIETATRELAKDTGELYVVTGPIFYGSELKRIDGRVLVALQGIRKNEAICRNKPYPRLVGRVALEEAVERVQLGQEGPKGDIPFWIPPPVCHGTRDL